MKRSVLIVCSMIGLLGLLSTITGFAAESEKTKLEYVEVTLSASCVYLRSSASDLGLTSAVALFVAEIIISIMTRCYYYRRGPHLSGRKCTNGLIYFILSWITCFIALYILFGCAAYCGEYSDKIMDIPEDGCFELRSGLFSLGASLSLASVALGIVSYLLSNSDGNVTNDLSRRHE